VRLQRIVPETIGLLPEEVPPKFKRINEGFAGEQDTIQKESTGLQGEISRFFERTQKKNYDEVNRAMTEARTGEELDKVRGLIAENISMEAAKNLATWSGRFNEWADKLEPKEKSSSGGGGSGSGGAEGEALLKELMALLRLRESESNLRAQTRLLEKKRTTDQASYQEGAPKISSSQQKLLEDLGKVRKENIFGELEQTLTDSHGAMQAAASLLSKPQTDKVTDQAQIKTIELLSDAINLINEQAQRGGGQQGSAAGESASLIQMMAMENSPSVGMGMGKSPGGSMAGGTTDQPALPQTGDARGKSADARKVGKASGISGSLPTEFREALENYFNAIEKEPN
jgi:hypothetical protein